MSAILDNVFDAVAGLVEGSPLQANRLLRATVAGASGLTAESFEGFEAIGNGGFRFELGLLSPDATFDPASLFGQNALVQLLTADSLSNLRPFHGLVTSAERVGANAGLARYRLVLEPWLALLKQQSDSRIWQDASAIDIAESLFGGLPGANWRWELADRSLYPQYSLKCQHGETAFDFLERLLASEGLFYWFEFQGDTSAQGLGQHTLVIADNNSAFKNSGSFRFHRADATETEDTLQQWDSQQCWVTSQVRLSTWDYRSVAVVPAEADAASPGAVPMPLAVEDSPGAYSYANSDQGQRLAQVLLQAHQVEYQQRHGAGTVRVLGAGTTFTLNGHPRDDGQSFACLRVEHWARNNLQTEVHAQVEMPHLAPEGEVEPAPELPEAWAPLDAPPPEPSAAANQQDLYYNTVVCLPAATAYRNVGADGHGRLLHPQASTPGPQTAVVVGASGVPVQTDRDHRIKVQPHWARGDGSHSRLSHPAGVNNAPADDTAGTWVRTAVPQAGPNWGGNFVPRVGQEVLVDFLEGDIDRPVAGGGLYNGQGAQNDQYNQVQSGAGATTGNAPAWFAGETDGYGHPASLSGLKTQALATSQDGSGGYNQLALDDTPGEARLALVTTQQGSGLTLGHIKQQQDSQRLADRGHGAELSTQAAGSLRAGQGLLLTTEPGGALLDAPAAQGALGQGLSLVQSLAQTADGQKASLQGDPTFDKLPALKGLQQTQQALKATTDGGGSAGGGDSANPIKAVQGGTGTVPGWSRPDLVLSSPAGIVTLTAASHIVNAGNTAAFSAGQAIDWAAQGNFSMAVAHGIRLFTYGKAANPSAPVSQTGIALHAASGQVSLQSQSDATTIAASKQVTLASTTQDVNISANVHVLLTAAGAYLKIQGSDIELGAPGNVTFHAGSKVLTGPQSADALTQALPQGQLKLCEYKLQGADSEGAGVVNGNS